MGSYVRWTPDPSTIFGSTFVQGTRYAGSLEGVASYHFDAEDDCYISYSNALADWRHDDGSALPAKKPFLNASYDAGTRTFRGTILWAPTLDECARWEYEMVFAGDFSRIVSGTYRSFAPGRDTAKEVTRFQDPSGGSPRFSNDLCYVRKPGALLERPALREI